MSREYLGIIVVILLSFLIYSNSFHNEFVIDDPLHISENKLIRNWKNISLLFTKDYFCLSGERAYFPVVTLTYFVDYSLWGLNVFGYHLTNTLIHTLNSVLIYLVLYFLLQNWGIAFFSSLIFAVHPIHAESLNYISGRTDLLAMFFFLLAFYLYLRSTKLSTYQLNNLLPYLLSYLCFILALFSKEMAVTLPIILVLSDFCFKRNELWGKHFIRRYFFYFVIAFFFILGRFTVLKPSVIEGFDFTTPPSYIGKSFYFTLLTMMRGFSYYLKLLFLPTKLTISYVFSPSLTFLEPIIIFSAVFLSAIVIIGLFAYRKDTVLTFSVFYFFLTLLPVANIIPFGRVVQERYLYIPSLGFSIFLASIFVKVLKNNRLPFLRFSGYFCIFSILLFYSLRTIRRNFDWQNELNIWLGALKIYPYSEEALVYAGMEYHKRGEIDKAIDYYNRGLLAGPDYENTTAYAENNLGLIEMERKNYQEAINHFKEAIKVLPKYTKAQFNLAKVYVSQGNFEQAIKEYEKILSIDPYFEEAQRGLAMVYFALGNHRKGQIILEEIKKTK